MKIAFFSKERYIKSILYPNFQFVLNSKIYSFTYPAAMLRIFSISLAQKL